MMTAVVGILLLFALTLLASLFYAAYKMDKEKSDKLAKLKKLWQENQKKS